MTSLLPYPIHSITDVAKQIDQGEEPWFALGCFLHDWWCYAVDRRQNLIAKPPAPAITEEGKHWAKPKWTMWSDQELQDLLGSNYV